MDSVHHNAISGGQSLLQGIVRGCRIVVNDCYEYVNHKCRFYKKTLTKLYWGEAAEGLESWYGWEYHDHTPSLPESSHATCPWFMYLPACSLCCEATACIFGNRRLGDMHASNASSSFGTAQPHSIEFWYGYSRTSHTGSVAYVEGGAECEINHVQQRAKKF